MVKGNLYRQNHTKKHTHTHSQKEKMEKIYIYICIYIKKKRKRATKSINNLPVIVSSKYEATINIKL